MAHYLKRVVTVLTKPTQLEINDNFQAPIALLSPALKPIRAKSHYYQETDFCTGSVLTRHSSRKDILEEALKSNFMCIFYKVLNIGLKLEASD